MRGDDKVLEYRRKRDLFVWRGQMIFGYLLSMGKVGTNTPIWKTVASENDTIPDMGDDSGDPTNNEFSPLIGSLVNVSYDFNPIIKPSGGYQAYADLMIEATIISDGSKTLRKVGIIDEKGNSFAVLPLRRMFPAEQEDNIHYRNGGSIIFEDSVVPFPVILNDEIFIRYTVQLG